MSTEALDLDAIRARADAASPGPWTWEDWILWGSGTDRYRDVLRCEAGEEPNDADRDFIAAARSDVPALLAEVEYQLGQAEDYRRRLHAVDKAWATLANERDELRAEVARLRHLEDAARALAEIERTRNSQTEHSSAWLYGQRAALRRVVAAVDALPQPEPQRGIPVAVELKRAMETTVRTLFPDVDLAYDDTPLTGPVAEENSDG